MGVTTGIKRPQSPDCERSPEKQSACPSDSAGQACDIYIPCMWPSFCLSLPLSSSLLYIAEYCCCCCQCFCCCCCWWWWSQPTNCLTLLGRVHLCQPSAFVTVIEKLSCITHGWGATYLFQTHTGKPFLATTVIWHTSRAGGQPLLNCYIGKESAKTIPR